MEDNKKEKKKKSHGCIADQILWYVFYVYIPLFLAFVYGVFWFINPETKNQNMIIFFAVVGISFILTDIWLSTRKVVYIGSPEYKKEMEEMGTPV